MHCFPHETRGRTAGAIALFLLAAFGATGFANAEQPNPDRHIVKFHPGKAAQARAAVAAARGAVVLEMPDHDAVAVEIPAAALQGLERNPNIEYIEPDVVRYPMALTTPSTGSPYASNQLVPYGIQMVQADALAGIDASNRKICIIDSGYDRGHPDLDASSNVSGEYDSGTGWWYADENHHGTHVAGTISALNNANEGVVGVVSNGKIKLHIVKVFGAAGWAYSSTLTNAVTKCAVAQANVISMSLGGSFSSRTEQSAFDKYYAAPNNILSIAAAGNDGNNRTSYPAGYASVVSVGAVDQNRNWATFSQYNKDVEIAAPGVGVLSTVPRGTGRDSTLTVGTASVASSPMDGSPTDTVSGALVDCGLGTSACTAAAGKVCLIQRGTNSFAEKVNNCRAGNGIGAVIYNNVAGMLYGTMGDVATSIPSVGISDTDGAALKANSLGRSTDLAVTASNYAYFDGTSMATPHVSAVAALVWSKNIACTAAQIRSILTSKAVDLGAAGRDTKYGFGLVQAKASYEALPTTGNCK